MNWGDRTVRTRAGSVLIAVALLGAAGAGGYAWGHREGSRAGIAEGRRLEARSPAAREQKACVVPSAWSAGDLLARLRAVPVVQPDRAEAWARAVNGAAAACKDERIAGVSLGDCLMAGGACGSCVVQAEAAARWVSQGQPIEEVRRRLAEEAWQDLDLSGSPSVGPDDAPVVLVEWSDFQCPYCRDAAEVLAEVRAARPSDVRVVWVDRPLESIHPQARPAAVAARAAARQGRFWPMHDRLFASQRELKRLAAGRGGEAPFESLAREIGLDVARFRADSADPALGKEVDDDLAQARGLGVTGTPTLFVGHRRWRGPRSSEALIRAVDEARAEGTGRVLPVGNRAPAEAWGKAAAGPAAVTSGPAREG